MDHYNDAEPINVGTGKDLEISELARMIGEIVHPNARLVEHAEEAVSST